VQGLSFCKQPAAVMHGCRVTLQLETDVWV